MALNAINDPYGFEYDDWEDPQFEHVDCTGCDMCAPWEGRTYEAIREERLREVARRRQEESHL